GLVTTLAGQADDADLLDVLGVAVQILELVGIDVLAARAEDHLLLAPDDVQVAVLVELADAAGIRVVDPHVDAGQRAANRAGDDLVAGPRHRQHGRALRHAVALVQV